MVICIIFFFIFRDLKNLLRQVGKSLYPLYHIQRRVIDLRFPLGGTPVSSISYIIVVYLGYIYFFRPITYLSFLMRLARVLLAFRLLCLGCMLYRLVECRWCMAGIRLPT